MLRRNYSSRLLERAVDELSTLPGIGRKSALRLALFILKQPLENVENFGNSFIELRKNIKYCPVCNMITDDGVCSFCSDKNRDDSVICVVESVSDVLKIENAGTYCGMYHVLGGIISPIDGVGPDDISISPLLKRIEKGNVKEVILVLSTSMEGETTSFYLYKKLSSYDIVISTIARGVGFGDDLEYADDLTLGKSIENRQPFKNK